jgi:putative N6-adenine-specific DNA methylase
MKHKSILSLLGLLLGWPQWTWGFSANSNLRSSNRQATTTTRLLVTAYSSYLATCIPGLSDVLAAELSEIHPDICDIETSGNAAVTFRATREGSLRALCWVRTAHRLLEVVAVQDTAEIYDRNDLMDFIKQKVNVKELLGDGKGNLLTLSVKAMLTNPMQLPQDLSHSHFSALTVKNALCDAIRDMRGDRPNVDTETPDVPLVVQLRGRQGGASVSLFRSLHSPGSLHRRGYRQGEAMHKAAMKESLAAGLLREAGWHSKVKESKSSGRPLRLVDPMAGSGSFALEAAMMAAGIAPALLRIKCGLPDSSLPPVTRWKSDVDTVQAWKGILSEASQQAQTGIRWMRNNPDQIKIQANDIHPGALRIMESSLQAAGLRTLVQTSNLDCYDLELMDDGNDIPYMVVTNPPWGVRLTEDIEDSWEGLRHYLRDVCPAGTQAFVLSGDKSSTKLLKLRRDRMVPIQTGEQILRWIHYTIRGAAEDKETMEEDGKPAGAKSKVAAQEDAW